MKKTIAISLVSIALLSGTLYELGVARTSGASVKAETAGRSALAARLPADLAVPAVLPASIQDPTLMEAWIRLYNRQETMRLWDGRTLTGQMLAETVLAQGIRVVWDEANVCRGGSCSIRYCSAGVCTFDDGQPGAEAIYVRPGERNDMPALVATLAHEAFHRTQPCGAVPDSRFEEYWAFHTEYQITAESWLTFGAYDPLDPYHLNMWIRENKLDPYLQIPAYPASIEPLVYRAASQSNGDPDCGLPIQALGID